MSVEAISWAFAQEIDDPIAKLVLLTLANFCNPGTGKCCPFVKTLAKQCSQSERNVQKKIADLEKMGLVERTAVFDSSGAQRGNSYRLKWREDLMTFRTDPPPRRQAVQETEAGDPSPPKVIYQTPTPMSGQTRGSDPTDAPYKNRFLEPKKKKEEEEDSPSSGSMKESERAKKYEFEYGIIRLNNHNHELWKKSFAHLSLDAELIALADWAGKQQNWFIAVAGALAKRERAAILAIETARTAADGNAKTLGQNGHANGDRIHPVSGVCIPASII